MLAFFAVSLLWHTLGLDPVPGLPDPDPLSAIQNALLTKIAWHGATWTIQGEVLAVPFILGFYFLRRWLGEIGLVFGLCYCLLSRENPGLLFSLPNITAVLTPMVIGMIAAAPGARAIGASMPPWTLWAMPAALFTSLVFFGLNEPTSELARVILAGALVAGCFYAPASSPLVRLLSQSFVQFCGRISYSLYLLNVPLIILFAPLAQRWLAPAGGLLAGIILGLAVFLATMPLAAWFERRVEQGGIRLGERLLDLNRPGRRRDQRAPAS